LALFVDAEAQRPVGWIEIEPDQVLHFGDEVLVARDFLGFHQMRLEPVRPLCAGHCCRKPLPPQPCCAGSSGSLSAASYAASCGSPADLLGRQRLDARWVGRILQQAVHPPRHQATAPATDRQQALVYGRRNRPPLSVHRSAATRCAPSKPPSAACCAPEPAFESFVISRGDPIICSIFLIDADSAGLRRFVNRLSATEH
jgi:hypothetical protein